MNAKTVLLVIISYRLKSTLQLGKKIFTGKFIGSKKVLFNLVLLRPPAPGTGYTSSITVAFYFQGEMTCFGQLENRRHFGVSLHILHIPSPRGPAQSKGDGEQRQAKRGGGYDQQMVEDSPAACELRMAPPHTLDRASRGAEPPWPRAPGSSDAWKEKGLAARSFLADGPIHGRPTPGQRACGRHRRDWRRSRGGAVEIKGRAEEQRRRGGDGDGAREEGRLAVWSSSAATPGACCRRWCGGVGRGQREEGRWRGPVGERGGAVGGKMRREI